MEENIRELLKVYATEEYNDFNEQTEELRDTEVNNFLTKYSGLGDDDINIYFNEIVPTVRKDKTKLLTNKNNDTDLQQISDIQYFRDLIENIQLADAKKCIKCINT
jgi:fructose-1-phosphate kinase PfkB-like protein